MFPFDPFGTATLNTAAAAYPCWECHLCDPPIEPLPGDPWPGGKGISLG